eukprot:m.148257 g.148257  ORF g.148257 m.148257 type:complete len:306 (-) comp9715_c1_seq1:410-1327(-)
MSTRCRNSPHECARFCRSGRSGFETSLGALRCRRRRAARRSCPPSWRRYFRTTKILRSTRSDVCYGDAMLIISPLCHPGAHPCSHAIVRTHAVSGQLPKKIFISIHTARSIGRTSLVHIVGVHHQQLEVARVLGHLVWRGAVGLELEQHAVHLHQPPDDQADNVRLLLELRETLQLALALLQVPRDHVHLAHAWLVFRRLLALSQVTDDHSRDPPILFVGDRYALLAIICAVLGRLLRVRLRLLRAGHRRLVQLDVVVFDAEDAALQEAARLHDVLRLDLVVAVEARKSLGEADHALQLADCDPV